MNVDIAKTIAALPGTAVLIGLLIAAALLVILVNWRLLILALGAQYILIGLMLTRVVPIELAAVKALVGIMICPVLYITARRVNWGRPEEDETKKSRGRSATATLVAHRGRGLAGAPHRGGARPGYQHSAWPRAARCPS